MACALPSDPRLKQIKIKTGVVKRLAKERTSYQEESVQLKAKVEKMHVDKKDEYDIRKQEEVFQESKMMIPDCLRRLKVAYADLENVVGNEKELEATEEYKAAQLVLKENRETVNS